MHMADLARANLLDFDRDGMRDFFAGLGEKPWRADQVMKWIYHRLESDFGAMTDLGKSLREKLPEVAMVAPPKALLDKASSDGTRKWLLGMDAATRSKRCTSRNRRAARCAFPRRSAAA